MPQIYTALASEVKVNEETIEGLQSIDYTFARNRQHIGAVGTDERIAVYFGLKTIVGKLRVASANATLDKLLQSNASFDITATLKHGETQRVVGFHSCYVEDKAFGLGSEGHAETVYSFTATRVQED